MKSFKTAFFLFICHIGIAQAITEVEYIGENVSFQRIDSVAKSKEELFLLSKEWLVNAFKSGKAVTELEDKEKGIIIATGMSEYTVMKYNFPIFLNHSIKIEVKENKVRFTIYDLYTGLTIQEKRTANFWFGPLCKGCKEKINNEHRVKIIDAVELLRSNYFKFINAGKEDW